MGDAVPPGGSASTRGRGASRDANVKGHTELAGAPSAAASTKSEQRYTATPRAVTRLRDRSARPLAGQRVSDDDWEDAEIMIEPMYAGLERE